jgi:hypothetical protein
MHALAEPQHTHLLATRATWTGVGPSSSLLRPAQKKMQSALLRSHADFFHAPLAAEVGRCKLQVGFYVLVKFWEAFVTAVASD